MVAGRRNKKLRASLLIDKSQIAVAAAFEEPGYTKRREPTGSGSFIRLAQNAGYVGSAEEHHDSILIDSSPITPVTDAVSISAGYTLG